MEHQDGSASTGDESNPRPFSFTRAQLGVSYRAQELIEAAWQVQEADLFGGSWPLVEVGLPGSR